jgi:predicted NBD/HSP70 family sugar kinase
MMPVMDRRPLAELRGAERQVAELLDKHGVLTRPDLARLSSLPLTTVTGAAARLRQRGLVEEARPAGTAYRPGRPAGGLRLTWRDSLAGAVVITHRVARAALVRPDGQLSGRIEEPLDWLQCPDIVAECLRLIAEARDRAGTAAALGHIVLGLPMPFKAGVGLSLLEKPVRPARRQEVPPAARWLFRDVAPELSGAFGVPATVDNESNLAALGELAFGVARGRRHVIYLKLVTGMGAGLIVNGELVHGAAGLAGELSHLHVDPVGPMCRCGARGCLGTLATADHVLDAARPLFGPEVGIYEVLGLAAQGDAAVRRVLEDVGRLVGKSLAPACVLLNPEMIVIDGTLGPAAASLINGLREELRRHMPAGTFRALTLALGQLGDTAELVSAARLLSSPQSATPG